MVKASSFLHPSAFLAVQVRIAGLSRTRCDLVFLQENSESAGGAEVSLNTQRHTPVPKASVSRGLVMNLATETD